jgi:aminoglycoside phosphotransferase (APT) family kinase protein
VRTEAEQRAWEAHPADLAAKLLRILEARARLRGPDYAPLNPGLAYAAPPTPLGGGHWAALYAFRLAGTSNELAGELVLRVMPTSDEQALREATIQSAVAAAGFPAPRVHFSAGRDAGLGFPFIVMARAAGMPKLNVLRLPAILGRTMAALHALEARPVAEALARAGVKQEEILDGLEERASALTTAGFADGIAWLRAHKPLAREIAVCHGDFHPFNLMLADGRVSAVLDWAQAMLADPAFDVAYTSQLLALWPLELRGIPRPLGRMIGRMAAWRFRRAYGRKLENLAWYEALHGFRVLVRVALARAGHTVPPLAHDHPWELIADDAARVFCRRTGVAITLPPR